MSLKDIIDATFGADTWPDNATVFQLHERDQVLLHDFTNTLAVKAYLRMCQLPFNVESWLNAQHMSPSGAVPFVHVGSNLIAGFQPIVDYVETKGIGLGESLSDSEKVELSAYTALVFDTLHNAEIFFCWQVPENSEQVSKPRTATPYPWPLNRVLPWMKGREMRSKLAAAGWLDKSYHKVLSDVEACLNALEERLGSQDYFFGDRPCSLDALVYGHLYGILTTQLPSASLERALNDRPVLERYCVRLDQELFGGEGDN